MVGVCLFCLTFLATAEVETAPTSTAKTHNIAFFTLLLLNAGRIAARNHSAPNRYLNRCPILKNIQSCRRDTHLAAVYVESKRYHRDSLVIRPRPLRSTVIETNGSRSRRGRSSRRSCRPSGFLSLVRLRPTASGSPY